MAAVGRLRSARQPWVASLPHMLAKAPTPHTPPSTPAPCLLISHIFSHSGAQAAALGSIAGQRPGERSCRLLRTSHTVHTFRPTHRRLHRRRVGGARRGPHPFHTLHIFRTKCWEPGPGTTVCVLGPVLWLVGVPGLERGGVRNAGGTQAGAEQLGGRAFELPQ